MNDKFVDMPKCMADKAVFRAGRGGQWVHYFVALVRESKGDHRGGGDEEMS